MRLPDRRIERIDPRTRTYGLNSAVELLISSWRYLDSEATAVTINVAHIQPLAALLGGILILLVPRLLNYIVAIYLILVGVLGLGLRLH